MNVEEQTAIVRVSSLSDAREICPYGSRYLKARTRAFHDDNLNIHMKCDQANLTLCMEEHKSGRAVCRTY